MAKTDPKDSDSPTSGRRGRNPVEKSLRKRIQEGVYFSGEMLPSERELSKEFGVSRASVQAAIRNLASDGYICQIQNCRPIVSHGTKQREEQNQKLIAVWIQPDLQDFGAATILHGIRAATDKVGRSVMVGFPSVNDQEHSQRSEVKFLEMILKQPNVDGAIVWETEAPAFRRIFDTLTEAKIPVVFIDREPPVEIEADVVSVNNRRGARVAVAHLVGLGHKSIAMISNQEKASSVRERIEGYNDAIKSIGQKEKLYTFDPDKMDKDPSECIEFIRQILSQPDPPTAFFCINDGVALRMQRAIAALGLSVPEDVSIVGFDWQFRSLPGGGDLTTVAQPFEAIGRIAAERLLDRIGSQVHEPTRHVLLEATLVIKSTSGSPATTLRDKRKTSDSPVRS